jgi:hypothetical protein
MVCASALPAPKAQITAQLRINDRFMVCISSPSSNGSSQPHDRRRRSDTAVLGLTFSD